MTTRKKTTAKKKTSTAKKRAATTKTTAKKAPAKKSPARKKTPAKSVKKATKKKAITKTPAKKKAAKKAPARSPAKKKATKKTAAKKTVAKKKPARSKESEARRETMKMLTRSKKHTPAVFKLPSKKNTPIVFSLEDVREVLKRKTNETEADLPAKAQKKAIAASKGKAGPAKSTKKQVIDEPDAKDHRVLKPASVADILGFNPQAKKKAGNTGGKKVPRKFQRYHRLLLELRSHVLEGLDLHTQETLKRSSKEDTGDLSSYSQHMADAGTDTFDRDFALSLLSTEQDALFEIESAVQRIFDGSYGICEITGQKINPERLEAVPFTRFSVEGQAEFEKSSRKKVQRQGVFLDSTVEGAVKFTDDDSD